MHLQSDAFKPTACQFNLLAGCQNGAAVGCLNNCVFAGCHVGAKHHHVATAGQHLAQHRHVARRCGAVAKTQAARQRVGIGHPEGGRGKARSVYHRACAYGNARLVDQHQVAVATQRAKELGWGVGNDPVDGGAGRGGLLEKGATAQRDGETLPVDGRVAGACAVLGGHQKLVTGGCIGGLADDGHATHGVGFCYQRHSAPRKRHAGREDFKPEPASTHCHGPSSPRRHTTGVATANLGHSNHGPQSLVPNRTINMV